MKILYLITKSNWGGAQVYVHDLATAFKGKGHETVVAFGGHGTLEEKLKKNGVKTISIESMERDVSIMREFAVAREMYRMIKEEKPDIIHLNSSKAAGIGSIIGRMLGVKHIVVTIHGAPFREDRKYISRRLIYFFTWLTCVFAHVVITVSKQDEADLGTMFFVKNKLRTIYLGLTYDPSQQVRTNPKDRLMHIVTVGDLTKNKGHLYGLQAMEKLKNENTLFKYTIIGEGEERQKIEEFIAMKKMEDVVELVGHRYARDVLHEYDIYFLPSIKEGLPYSLLEAGTAMLPVVATITGGVPEIIRHESTGLLAQPKDVEGLYTCLARIINDRKFGKQLGRSLHGHIVQNFSHAKMLVETAKAYGLIEG